MGAEPLERKLAAILYAVVAGYSRLTGADEEGTHRALSAYLDAITTSIERHNGKVLHYAGDAVLADFATVSDALTCAVQVQRELKDRNQDLPDDRKVQFRIGAYVHTYKKRHDEAISDLQKAITLDPNYADAYALLASIRSYTGRLDEVIALIRKAMRLNPHFPSHYFTVLGRAYYLAGRFDEAITTLQTAIDRNYNYLPHHVHLAATYARMGQQDEAEWEVELIVTLDPDFSLEFVAKTYPYKDPAHLNRLMNDLRKAGLPE